MGGALVHPVLHKNALLVPAAILACGGLGHACYVAFVLNIGFWEHLRDSARNSQPRQVLYVVDGEVLDVSGTTTLVYRTQTTCFWVRYVRSPNQVDFKSNGWIHLSMWDNLNCNLL